MQRDQQLPFLQLQVRKYGVIEERDNMEANANVVFTYCYHCVKSLPEFLSWREGAGWRDRRDSFVEIQKIILPI
jgi:hypothetical protein